MTKRDPKSIILARRAQFLATALAGTIACGKTTGTTEPSPQPCLSVAYPAEDAAVPTPCLTVAPPQPDPPPPTAKTDAGVKPPPPRVCLSVRMPRDGGSGEGNLQ